MRTLSLVISGVLILLVAGCDGSGPNKSGNTDRPLAGGGRLENDDPFDGHGDTSGTFIPDPDLWEGMWPIFYSDRSCADQSAQVVISDSAAWETWWESRVGCLGWTSPHGGPDGMIPNTPPGDSSSVCDTCKFAPPYVNFEHNVVLAINLAYDSGSFCHRSIWIQSVETNESGTTVHYEVTRLDSTCCMMFAAPFVTVGVSPAAAVVVPRPVSPHVTWEWTDVTHGCWQPDPNDPVTLYYTDAECALGDAPQIITDVDRWNEWLDAAWACEKSRWPDDTTYYPPEDSSDGTVPSDTFVNYPIPDWEGFPDPPIRLMDVDFTEFAVIILRAGSQSHWGGGIWLSALEKSGSGTEIAYTVMEPANNCPPIESFTSVNPTVAVRVRLPLDPPVTWTRSVETISCDWGADSSWVGIDPNGGGR